MANGGNGYNESEDDKDSLYLPLLADGANGDNESEDDKAETPCEEAPHIAYSDSEDGKMETSFEEEPHIADSDSEDGIIELSLSQASLFLTKMDEFFFKCDVFNVNTKRDCLKDLKIADLRNLFCQNAIQNEQQSVPDQQKPSSSKDSRIDQKKMTERVVDSDLLMKLLIVKGMQKLNNPSSSLQQLRKEMLRQHGTFDVHIMDKIFDYHNNNKFSILTGLLQFGRIFTEKFGIYAVKKLYLGLNVEMLWKNITIHIYMYDHPGEEMDALERFLKSAGLI
ncbi:hypothetical protein niasHS_013673 [Heterodera schachtii]|uniref:Uncharacterized protein n=1 Tax=Heterodera schachtii TaxID=97005 RepID=A0ABD2IAG1_HETSC